MTLRWCWSVGLQLLFPALLFGAGIDLGYSSCEHDVGFELFLLTPFIVTLALGLAIVSTLCVTVMAPRSLRAPLAVLHIILIALTTVVLRKSAPLGQWIWEQHILRPRQAALRRFIPKPSDLEHRPVVIDGQVFSACQRFPEGVLLYTVERGIFPSTGIFVPFAEDYRGFAPPEEGRPAIASWVAPTSVPGLFWLETKD